MKIIQNWLEIINWERQEKVCRATENIRSVDMNIDSKMKEEDEKYRQPLRSL